MEGWRHWLTRPEKTLVQKNKITHLTPTGLLMEGVNTSLRFYSPSVGVNDCHCDDIKPHPVCDPDSLSGRTITDLQVLEFDAVPKRSPLVAR